jgi:hypothetical protein
MGEKDEFFNNAFGDQMNWEGCFPVTFSNDEEVVWLFDKSGSLIKLQVKTGKIKKVSGMICEDPTMLELCDYHKFPELVIVGRYGDWAIVNPKTDEVIFHSSLEIEDRRVAACKPCPEGFLTVVTFPDHRPAKLILFLKSSPGGIIHKSTEIILGWGYKPTSTLSVSLDGYKVACPYGNKGQDLAVIDYQSGKIVSLHVGNIHWLQSCCFIERKNLFVSGCQVDGKIFFWRLSDAWPLFTIDSGMVQVNNIVWVDELRTLFAIGSDHSRKVVEAWNLERKAAPKTLDLSCCKYATRIGFSPSFDILLAGDRYINALSGEYNPIIMVQDVKSFLTP